MYTCDGRDVEMSVASTKAFYAQVAAGVLLACAITEAAGRRLRAAPPRPAARRCGRCPMRCSRCSLAREVIAEAARRFAPPKRYWAIVGNGPNTVAAEEVRIKLSELCYKSIACDVTEDKKHIDLSCEPLILVCAAGLVGGTADDVAKEVAIYKAHKATPDRHRHRGRRAVRRRGSGAVGAGGRLGAGLRAVGDGRPPVRLRGGAGDRRLGSPAARGPRGDRACPGQLRQRRRRAAQRCGRASVSTPSGSSTALRSGLYDGHLEASTAVRLSALLADLRDDLPLEAYQRATGKVATPGVMIDDLTASLTRAIEELTRPVDAIKHQAKTVTVGISRSDEGVLDRALVQAMLAAGAGRDRAQLPHAEGARRPRPGGAVRGRLHPLPHRRRSGGRRPDLDRRPWWPLAARCRAASSATRSWSAPSAASPPSARCWWPVVAATGARSSSCPR